MGEYFDGYDTVPIPPPERDPAPVVALSRLDQFQIAGPVWRWVLRRLGLLALVMPWGRVYVLPDEMINGELIAHECVHLDQIERLGPWRFSVLYVFWLIKYGYRANPLEVEAYAVSDRWAGRS